jgi:hypothetical protein
VSEDIVNSVPESGLKPYFHSNAISIPYLPSFVNASISISITFQGAN